MRSLSWDTGSSGGLFGGKTRQLGVLVDSTIRLCIRVGVLEGIGAGEWSCV